MIEFIDRQVVFEVEEFISKPAHNKQRKTPRRGLKQPKALHKLIDRLRQARSCRNSGIWYYRPCKEWRSRPLYFFMANAKSLLIEQIEQLTAAPVLSCRHAAELVGFAVCP